MHFGIAQSNAYAGTEQPEISQLLDKVKNELNAIMANKEDKRNDD